MLENAELALSGMIEDYLQDTAPRLSEKERKSMAASMNMTLISQDYRQDIRYSISNLLKGRIERNLLVQLQSMQVEVYRAMETVDDIFDANQINIQLLALFPAVLLGSALLQAMYSVAAAVGSTSILSVDAINSGLSDNLYDAQRLLKPTEGRKGSGWFFSKTYKSSSRYLAPRDLGALVLLLRRCELLLVKLESHHMEATRRRIDETLKDLLLGGLTKKHQREMLDRLLLSERSLTSPESSTFLSWLF
mmetsp:Transcript_43194/g.59030  ORF Transcript_43194/g.59030 Transcript_43194/m.59030 type:complete len:249 (-) Transcript_43194:215-961(-)